MTAAAPPTRRASRPSLAAVRGPVLLWLGFLLVHAWLWWLNIEGPGLPMGDVTLVYHFWVDEALVNDFWVGIDSRWVYPIVAFVPMLGAMVLGASAYAATWLAFVTGLNALALGVLTGWGTRPERRALGWWWLLFLALLGPIALGRVDSVSVPIAMIGVLVLASHPRVAAVLLTTAMWIKVWPAAVLAAIVVTVRSRVQVVGAALALSAGIIGLVGLYGGLGYVFSFISEQSSRGLQIEAPVSTAWLWLAAAGTRDTFVYYDQGILTFQVQGAGVGVAAALMTPLLALVAIALCGLAILAVRRGVQATELLAPLTLALVTAFLVVNKVGSPQFESWLAVPIVLGLVQARRGGGSFRVLAILVLVIAALTQLVYPTRYDHLLALEPGMLLVLTARNLLLVALLVLAVLRVTRLARGVVRLGVDDPELAAPELIPPKKVVS